MVEQQHEHSVLLQDPGASGRRRYRTVTTTALGRVIGVVCGELATRAFRGWRGLADWRVSRWVGLVLRLVRVCSGYP